MANNHGVDYGPVGLADSLAAIRATGFPVVGIGADAARAYAPFRATVRGARIAIIGATQVLDDALISRGPRPTPRRARVGQAGRPARRRGAGRRARRATRWSCSSTGAQERNTCPTPTQQTLAHQLVDAGADIIVGSHAHRLLGGGRLGHAFVDYGLGNFAFYSPPGPTAESGVLLVTVTGPPRRRVRLAAGRDQRRRAAAARGCGRRRGAAASGPPAAVAPTSHREVDSPRGEDAAYDEFGLFHENAEEFGIPWRGPPAVRRDRGGDASRATAISALVWGDGPPELVLLHGGAQNAHTWDTVALALDRPLVAIDLPGHGHSSHRDDHVYWPRRQRRSRSSRPSARSRPTRSIVVGMSLGGLTALALTDRAPDLVRQLVLVDVTPGVNREKSTAIAKFIDGPEYFESFDEILERTIEFNPTRTESSLRRGILHNAIELPDGRWRWRYDLPRRGTGEGEQGSIMPGLDDLWDMVGRVKVPLTLVRGSLSPVVDDDDVARAAAPQTRRARSWWSRTPGTASRATSRSSSRSSSARCSPRIGAMVLEPLPVTFARDPRRAARRSAEHVLAPARYHADEAHRAGRRRPAGSARRCSATANGARVDGIELVHERPGATRRVADHDLWRAAPSSSACPLGAPADLYPPATTAARRRAARRSTPTRRRASPRGSSSAPALLDELRDDYAGAAVVGATALARALRPRAASSATRTPGTRANYGASPGDADDPRAVPVRRRRGTTSRAHRRARAACRSAPRAPTASSAADRRWPDRGPVPSSRECASTPAAVRPRA